MSDALRVLLVEDCADDARLLEVALRDTHASVTWQRVWTPEDFVEALRRGAFDVVICDHVLPRFDSRAALRLLRDCGLDVPFVIVSGSIPVATALEAMREGASDFLSKDDLARLGAVIDREVRQAGVRRARREAERRAAEYLQRFECLVGSLDDFVFTLDHDLRHTGLHGRWVAHEGVTAAQFLGRTAREILGAEAGAIHEAEARRALLGEGRCYEWSFAGAGGERYVQTRLSPMRDHQGRIVGIVGIGREITALRQAQAQLVLADRMLSVGLLAAGVAHEINNPLSAVIGNLEYAATLAAQLTAAGSGDPATLADLSCVLADTRAAADRIREVAADLRLFVRTPEREIHSVAVDQVLDASARLLRNEIRHRARIVRRYEVVPRVRASEPRLSQVFINLLVNAAQAMPIGRAEENEIRLYVHQDPAGDVVVEIADTGMGMTPEVQRRLFTPFFTTKGRDMGTGLGLSVCSRLVSGMGGRIEVQSDPGRGSTFKLVLPPDRSGAADATTVEIATPPPEWNGVRRGRILVVDDDEAVGTALRRLLTPHHEVTVSRSAKEALDHLLEGAACYDLILCDLMMPDQTGLDLLEALEVSLPDEARKVVLMTAGAFSPEAYHALASAALVVVEKPIGPDRLRDLLAARMG